MTGHDFNFGFVQLACLSTLYSLYRARDANFKAETTFSLQPSCIFNSLLLESSSFRRFGDEKGGKKGGEEEKEREKEREREEDFGGYFRQKQANAGTRDRIVAGRVSLIRHRGITYGSLMSPYQRYLPIPWALLLPPVPTRTAPLDFQLPAPLTYTHL